MVMLKSQAPFLFIQKEVELFFAFSPFITRIHKHTYIPHRQDPQKTSQTPGKDCQH